jgi:two-component system CheB/CheR fusion protein
VKKPPKVAERGAGKRPRAASKAPAKVAVSSDGPRPAGDPPASFPIVGLGASAGGLEALEQFLRHLPPKSGLAFVVVQHLDPTHKGMLVELLQRSTAMPVMQAQDGVKVEREHVYVIPPGKDISLMHGALHLLPQTSPRGLNLPIDFFFRSLAEDQQERSIGVVLSGMGSDGTLGLRAIKEKAGACFVQELASAKFDGMPRSAIEAGLADVVAPVEELPGKIVAYRQHTPHISRSDAFLEDKAQGGLEKVFVLLRAHTGSDFSLYKQTTIYRRIERRMGLHQIDGIGHYVRFLRENPREIDLLFKELLIGVTSFFRDPAAWEHLKKDAMPALLAQRTPGVALRAWVPGCSTGEEAYSLAMVFKEVVEPLRIPKRPVLQIFATDLDKDAIEKARSAVYPDSIAADVSPERLRRFFVQEENGFRVSKDIREMVVFATQNLIMDPPFTKLDILSCRNLLIYLSSELQKKLIPLFHYSLNPAGILFLGSAETIGPVSGLFSPVDGKARLYRRLEQSVASLPVEFPASARHVSPQAAGEPEHDPSSPKAANIQTLADRVLVQRFSPLGVLCTDKGDILYISGRAGRFLEPAVGKANLNVFAMAREGLRYELSRAFSAARRHGRSVTVRGLKVGANGATQAVDLTVERLTEPKELTGAVMIVIADAQTGLSAPKGRPRRAASEPHRLVELRQELERAREEIQSTREEMQTSQEELKSTNEELQSTNEELQSSNEELTTSKEEMQSLNEELQTVNHELQAKVDELSRSNNDMKNLLNSTEIATLFLDDDLNVRRFTTPTTKIIKLIPGDAGRPITDLRSDLDYPNLAGDAREVLRTRVFKETEVATRDGRWYEVRIMPYRTLESSVDGVVITFSDTSASKALEKALRDQVSHLQQMADQLPNLVWGSGSDGGCDYLSRQWLEYTGVPLKSQLGDGWLEQIHPDDRERVRIGWRAAIKMSSNFDSELRIRRSDGAYRWFKARSIPIRDPRGGILKWYGTSTDFDEKKREELAGRQAAVQGDPS